MPSKRRGLARYVYAFRFTGAYDGGPPSVYVGLTVDVHTRLKAHVLTPGPVRQGMRGHSSRELVTHLGPVPEADAARWECELIQWYKVTGWRVLNQVDGGALGRIVTAPRVLSLREMQGRAASYMTRMEFKKKDRAAYEQARVAGVLDTICGHMITPARKPNGYWNDLGHCRSAALGYDSRFKFKRGAHGAYASAVEHGWLDDICSHMTDQRAGRRVALGGRSDPS